jgi:secondary thiamine-phosphate synthase enzyme
VRQLGRILQVATRRGLNEVTPEVQAVVLEAGVRQGLCTVFIRHTSASLVIQENADPDVQRDLAAFLDRLVPDGDPLYRHVSEGDDDMPSHVKAALTRSSEQVPILEGALALGTWQGIYVWEHRQGRRRRELVVHVIGADDAS